MGADGMPLAALAISALGIAAVSLLVTEWVRRHAGNLGLLHAPNARSSHVRLTPHGGGLGIVAAGSLAGLGLGVAHPEAVVFWPVLSMSLLVAAVGLADDIRPLPARWRLLVQVVVCLGVLLGVDWGGPGQPAREMAGLGVAGLLLLLLAGVWWINLFNFMDGIDGLAAGQAVFMLGAGGALAAWFAPGSANQPLWQWMCLLAVAVAAFLWANWPPAKIFMGDVGSTYLGFLLFCLSLATVAAGWLTFPVWSILAALFVVDATLTLLRRMLRGERFYEAHRSHLYQRLARHWRGHRPVTLLAAAFNLLLLTPLAWAALRWPQWGWWLAGLLYLALAAVMLAAQAGLTARDPDRGPPR